LEDSKNRLSLNGLSLGESYIKGNSCLAVDYGCVRGEAPNSRDTVFIEAYRGPRKVDLAGFSKSQGCDEIGPGDRRSDRDHSFVNVQISEGVEGPKEISPATVGAA
jgi:hypothetical protein